MARVRRRGTAVRRRLRIQNSCAGRRYVMRPAECAVAVENAVARRHRSARFVAFSIKTAAVSGRCRSDGFQR